MRIFFANSIQKQLPQPEANWLFCLNELIFTVKYFVLAITLSVSKRESSFLDRQHLGMCVQPKIHPHLVSCLKESILTHMNEVHCNISCSVSVSFIMIVLHEHPWFTNTLLLHKNKQSSTIISREGSSGQDQCFISI